MKTPALLIALSVLLAACEQAPDSPGPEAQASAPVTPAAPVATLELGNPSDFPRRDTLVSLSLNELGVTEGPLQAWAGARALPSQLVDEDGDGAADRLVFLADLEAGARARFVIDRRGGGEAPAQRAHAEVSIKRGGQWQDAVYVGGEYHDVEHVTAPPQATDHSEYLRYEGPGIESDRVAYRVYLDWRNGFDIFGKKVTSMVLKDVGLDGYDRYHEMAEWGADILKVGQSLGMGGYGYWNGDSTVLVSDVAERSVSIRADGPVFASLDLDYRGWNTGTDTIDLRASLSMQAGSPMVDVTLETSTPLDNLVIGLVAHPEAEVMTGDLEITGEAWSYLATFGHQTVFDDPLGMVVMFRKKDLRKQTRDDNSHVLVMRPRRTTLSYAFGALWSGQPDGVQSREELVAWLDREVERRTLAPRLRLKTQTSKAALDLPPLEIARRLGQSEMARRGDSLTHGQWDPVRGQTASWTYTTGLLMEAMDELSRATGEPRFADYARRTMDSYLEPDGTIRGYSPQEFNIDHINPGKMLQRLYRDNPDERYRAAIDSLTAQLVDHPRTSDGAFWHKQRYPHQLWLDGVYMGMPFWAGVGVMEGDRHKLEEAAHEFILARAHLRNPETGLYFHAWDEARAQDWADPETGRSRFVWGRGQGWFAMALVDILELIPEEETELRAPLLDMVPELAEDLLRVQDATGTWWQIVDMPDAPGNYRESSSSAMFTYFLAKAVNLGYLPDRFADDARRAFEGLVSEFIAIHADGTTHLTSVCEVAGLGYGRDGSYRYYMSERVVDNDPKGLGPAILAAIEVSRLPN